MSENDGFADKHLAALIVSKVCLFVCTKSYFRDNFTFFILLWIMRACFQNHCIFLVGLESNVIPYLGPLSSRCTVWLAWVRPRCRWAIQRRWKDRICRYYHRYGVAFMRDIHYSRIQIFCCFRSHFTTLNTNPYRQVHWQVLERALRWLQRGGGLQHRSSSWGNCE